MGVLEVFDPNDWKDVPIEEMVLYPGEYPNYGLYKTLQQIGNIRRRIYKMKIGTQMTYADAITRRYALNQHFVKVQEEMMSLRVSNMNVTSIGNLAFMAYHNPGTIFSITYGEVMEKKPHLID